MELGGGNVMRFFLGTHQPGWLNWSPVPLFVSDRRLRGYKTLPRAAAPWALDSGGFSELSTHGSWEHGPTPAQYVARVRRYRDEIGRLAWAAPQDWMCEPFITTKTGLTVAEHQRRTVDNYRTLRELGPELPWTRVAQGFSVNEYLAHVDMYEAAGIDLSRGLVGVGSVCRRQGTAEVRAIFTALHTRGVQTLHGFGLKKKGLALSGGMLTSADSMAWSYDARRKPPLAGCLGHINCANCSRFALSWRADLLASLAGTP